MTTEKTGVVYRIYHKESMKSYIGKTIYPDKRIRDHLNGITTSPFLKRAIKKYGRETFSIQILESNVQESLLSKLEILHIRFFNSKAPNGYNLTDGGEGVSGLKKGTSWNKGKSPSPETLRKMSEAKKGKRNSPSTEFTKGQTSWNKGRKGVYSDETIQKMRSRDYESAHTYYISLPADMPLRDKCLLLRKHFPNRGITTIYRWIRQWESEGFTAE